MVLIKWKRPVSQKAQRGIRCLQDSLKSSRPAKAACAGTPAGNAFKQNDATNKQLLIATYLASVLNNVAV